MSITLKKTTEHLWKKMFAVYLPFCFGFVLGLSHSTFIDRIQLHSIQIIWTAKTRKCVIFSSFSIWDCLL